MKRAYEYLLIGVFVMTALLVAAVGLRTYSDYMDKKEMEAETERQNLEELMARNEAAQQRALEMASEIQEMAAQDTEALQTFIDEAVLVAAEVQNRKKMEELAGGSIPVVSDNVSDGLFVSGNDTISGNVTVSGNQTVSGNDTVSGNATVSGNEILLPDGTTVSGNDTVSGNMTVSGNATVSGNMTVSGNEAMYDKWRPQMTLEDRRQIKTSYEETLAVNQEDKERIADNQFDFSGMKVACLGDSITAAANLEDEEGYLQYAYPSRLQELLGAEEVYNLGIGGSSIGRYWADAFVERYTEIPEDTDIIIVMGGTNDGFCVSDDEFGNLDERAYRTFCGDLNELMDGLHEHYPDAVVFFATPLPNVLQDCLMSEREYLLPQNDFVEVIQELAYEYDYELVDLYNSNVLDSHDANIITEYMPDGVHGNPDGYQILAERIASEIVEYYNEEDETEAVGEEGFDEENPGESSFQEEGSFYEDGSGEETYREDSYGNENSDEDSYYEDYFQEDHSQEEETNESSGEFNRKVDGSHDSRGDDIEETGTGRNERRVSAEQ